jgi:hypothetical protein
VPRCRRSCPVCARPSDCLRQECSVPTWTIPARQRRPGSLLRTGIRHSSVQRPRSLEIACDTVSRLQCGWRCLVWRHSFVSVSRLSAKHRDASSLCSRQYRLCNLDVLGRLIRIGVAQAYLEDGRVVGEP